MILDKKAKKMKEIKKFEKFKSQKVMKTEEIYYGQNEIFSEAKMYILIEVKGDA